MMQSVSPASATIAVDVEQRNAQIWITISRAEKANAMTVAMVERMTSAIAEAGSNPDVQTILLTGAGTRVFSAGVDVREKPVDGDQAGQRERRSHALASLQDAVMNCPKPVITVLNGTASGAGAMLALLSDACVAADEAELTLPEINLSIPTFSGANILEVIGGRALALDLIQTGRRMPAREALSRGLITSVVPPSELQSAAEVVAEGLGSKDPHAFAANKRWINRSLKKALNEAREEHARHRQKVAK